jgi:hypothetical protein
VNALKQQNDADYLSDPQFGGHNHETQPNGTLVPTYPTYRSICPLGCDTLPPRAYGDSLTPDARWKRGWMPVANASLPFHMATVEAVDASGAAFGFSVCAGTPELAHRMALDLAARLSAAALSPERA